LKKALAIGLILLFGFSCATSRIARQKPRLSKPRVMKPAATPAKKPASPPAPTSARPSAPPSPERNGNTAAAKVPPLLPTHFNAKDRSVMVLVPTGKYTVGLPPRRRKPAGEGQAERTSLLAFYIDRTEITIEQYRLFDRRYPEQHPPCPTCPATGINWMQASRYCLWAGKRLPREAEWEAAARGPGMARWPWGNDFLPEKGNTAEEGARKVLPVGSYPSGASPSGALDMAGNVWEWVRSPLGGAVKSESGERLQVLKGGGFLSDARAAEISFRNFAPTAMKHAAFGFRCVKPPPRAVSR
jgi:formylglycine-generating enzyme required for sulfatase activity